MGNQCSCIIGKRLPCSDFLINNETKLLSNHCNLNAPIIFHKQSRPNKNSDTIDKLSFLHNLIIKTALKRNSYFKNNTLTSTSNNQNNHAFTITQLELNEVFNQYPPLNDDIKIELAHFIDSIQSEYHGEINPLTKEKHGRGIQLFLNKAKYVGQYSHDKMHGKGRITNSKGDYYEGDFIDDKAEGYGINEQSNGVRYVGYWKNFMQHGQGRESYPDKVEYVGEFVNGNKEGKGKLVMKNGAIYEGDFYRNAIHGKGRYSFPDKEIYEGEFKCNKMNGEGVFTYPDGRVYKGHYFEDEKDGYGVYNYSDGKIYKGYWKKGKPHGDGEMFNPNTQRWKKGLWNEGKCVRYTDVYIDKD